MSLSERLANLSIPTVLTIMVVLLAIRFGLRKQQQPVLKSIAETAESLAVALGLVFLLIRPFIVQAFFIPSASMHPTLVESDHILVNKFIFRFRQPRLKDVVVFKAPPQATPGETKEKDFIKRVIAVPGDTVRITAGYVLINNAQFSHSFLQDRLTLYREPGGEGNVKLVDNGALVDGKLIGKAEIADALDQSGAKVRVVPGKVYLNGKALVEPYTAEDPGMDYPPTQDQYIDPSWIVTVDGQRAVKIPPGKLLVMGDNRNNSNDARFWGPLDRKRLMGKAMFIFWPLNRIRWIH